MFFLGPMLIWLAIKTRDGLRRLATALRDVGERLPSHAYVA